MKTNLKNSLEDKNSAKSNIVALLSQLELYKTRLATVLNEKAALMTLNSTLTVDLTMKQVELSSITTEREQLTNDKAALTTLNSTLTVDLTMK